MAKFEPLMFCGRCLICNNIQKAKYMLNELERFSKASQLENIHFKILVDDKSSEKCPRY